MNSEIIWNDIPDYEGLYQANNIGQVRALNRIVRHSEGYLKYFKGRIIRQTISKLGYSYFTICKDSYKKTVTAHRIIALAFIPNPENKPFVNHINGIKSDNRIENLEWCTAKENLKHMRDVLNIYPNTKFTNEQIRKMASMKNDHSLKSLAKIFNTCPLYLSKIFTGKRRQNAFLVDKANFEGVFEKIKFLPETVEGSA